MHDDAALRRARGLDGRVARAFFGGFAELRAAQAASIPPLINGRDTVVLAGTGSGKTEAVVAPLVSRLLHAMRFAERPIILYVVPTRALANDVVRRLAPPLEQLDLRVGVRHGERNDLSRVHKPALLITTPESVDVVLSRQPATFRDVEAVIIDEAHLLYNRQRGMQLAILLRRLELTLGRKVQVAACSATVADGSDLWKFFRPAESAEVVHDPTTREIQKQIRLGLNTHDLAALVDRIGIGEPAKVLVFTNSRRECDKVAADLREHSAFGDRVLAHHASLSKDVRVRTEQRFLEESRAICVATSTLELGIDIGDIDLVVLWGRATGWESLLQRTGRGNRRSRTVAALCVVPDDRTHLLSATLGYQALFEQIGSQRFEADDPLDLYGAACQQVLSIIASREGWVSINELCEVFEPWDHVGRAELDAMLSELVDRGVVVKHPVASRYGPGDRLHEVVDLRLIWSNIPLQGSDFPVFSLGHELGRLPGQNLMRFEVGSVFPLGGRRHRVTRIRTDRVDTEPTQNRATVDLVFGGNAIELDPTLAESIGILLATGASVTDGVVPTAIADSLGASTAAFQDASRPGTVVRCWLPDGVCHFTFAGQLMNRLLAAFFGLEDDAATELGVIAPEPLDFARLPEAMDGFGDILRRVDQDTDKISLFQSWLPAELLLREWMQPWHRRPVYRRTLARIRVADAVDVRFPVALPTG